MDDCFR